MNNPNHSRSRSLAFLVSVFAWTSGQAVTPVLDRYAYLLSSNVSIDLDNKIISFSSNMSGCQQADGSPPTDTSDYAVFTNNQFIGLQRMSFNTRTNRLWMISETNDLTCANGLFIDPLFDNGFDVKLLSE
jgi:hypothetical protein